MADRMQTFRTRVVLDFTVPPGMDEDAFTTSLSNWLEDESDMAFDVEDEDGNELGTVTMETVREINVDLLKD
jgi:hypothetical protein